MFAFMMLAQPVSAGTVEIRVDDARGDLGPKYDAATASGVLFWPSTMPLVKVGYFDMLSFWLSYSTDDEMYTFGMELAKALPTPGSALPYGFKRVSWLMWIDAEPWNPVYNPAAETLFTVQLVYNGVEYVAELRQGLSYGPVLESLTFDVNQAEFEVYFSADSIGDVSDNYWMPCTVVEWSVPHAGYWDLDSTDPESVEGQVWWDIPWLEI